MNDVRKDELVRLSGKRELTPEEESRLEGYFAESPGARAAWEEERALSRALRALPDLPVSSNFTSRVLQEIDRDERQAERRARPWFQVLWPRLGWATAVVLGGVLVFQHRAAKEDLLVSGLARVSQEMQQLKQLPEPELLQDFEVIERLSQAAPSDDELLAALQ